MLEFKMKGLDTEIDWARFTLENRILDNEVKYSESAESWQTEIDRAIASHQRVYLQLARGHDKTDRYAWWSLLWLLTTNSARGYCAGVDRDNAALFRDSSKKLKALHPALFASIDVQKNMVICNETGSWIETISSDADSAYGLNFDLLIINDFHAWPKKEFWDILWTACGKKPGIRIWLESNAVTLGAEGSEWVIGVREWVASKGTLLTGIEGKWWYYCPRGFLATWQKQQLKQWQETMHPSQYRRLIDNVDTSGEESFVTIDQVQAITTLASPTPFIKKEHKKGHIVTACDIGLKKDATAIATIHSSPVSSNTDRPILSLLALDVLVGSFDDPVQLTTIEKTLIDHHTRFSSYPLLIDPWGAASIIQRYPGKVLEFPFTAASVRELTMILFRAITDKNLQLYPDAGKAYQYDSKSNRGDYWTLQRELVGAVMKDTSYGQRVDHKSGGFSDRLMAVGMCVHYLMSSVNNPRTPTPPSYSPKQSYYDQIMDSFKPVIGGLLNIGGAKK